LGHTGHKDVSDLLLVWQANGAEHCFEELLDAIREIIEGVARRVLHHHHIDDPAAIDDAVSLVFDHLRRLSPHARAGRLVSPFRPRNDNGASDSGVAYVTWLATERARDVARGSRVRARRAKPFSQLDNAARHSLNRFASLTPPADRGFSGGDTDADGDRAARLAEALQRIDPPLAHVITLLLEGKTQAAIAADLGVCEGTVSRMRTRAIIQLRRGLRLDA
jgi:RNA polymerase sigma factor (sigma-70 family)